MAAAADILLEATSGEVFSELNRVFGPNVIDSVTGARGGPYTVTFNSAKGNVDALKGVSDSGLTVQSRTLTEGITGNTAKCKSSLS